MKKRILIGILFVVLISLPRISLARTLPDMLGVWGVDDNPVMLHTPMLQFSEDLTGISKADGEVAPAFTKNVRIYYYLDHAPIGLRVIRLKWQALKKIAEYRWTTLELFIPEQEIDVMIKPISAPLFEIVPQTPFLPGLYMFFYRGTCYSFRIE